MPERIWNPLHEACATHAPCRQGFQRQPADRQGSRLDFDARRAPPPDGHLRIVLGDGLFQIPFRLQQPARGPIRHMVTIPYVTMIGQSNHRVFHDTKNGALMPVTSAMPILGQSAARGRTEGYSFHGDSEVRSDWEIEKRNEYLPQTSSGMRRRGHLLSHAEPAAARERQSESSLKQTCHRLGCGIWV